MGNTFESHFDESNFIFRIDVETPVMLGGTTPGTSATALDGEKQFVLRIANPRVLNLSHKNRIQNTVAAMFIARNGIGEALSPEEQDLVHVVPKVYEWMASTPGDTSDPKSWGWILCEYKEGENLASVFSTLPSEEKTAVMMELAAILYGLQHLRLPKNLDRFGGFDFSDNGDIINGGMFHLKGRPWDLYTNVWTAKVRCIIEDDFKERGLIKDWKEEGLVLRMKDFLLLSGLKRALSGVDSSQMAFVHGEFSRLTESGSSNLTQYSVLTLKALENMLYDTEKKSVTALLDFDLATISNPADEFLTGLDEVGGGFTDKPPELLVCLFGGDFSITLDNPTQDDLRKWDLARTWHQIATQREVLTPSCMRGFDKIARLHKMLKELYIPKLPDEDKAKLSPVSPAVVEAKEEVEERMLTLIGRYGY